jgi:hypothetical protein
MSLVKSIPPAAAVAAFSAGLPTFLSGPNGLMNRNHVGAPPAIPSGADVGTAYLEAQPVFTLTLKDAANNAGVISPAPAGWRCFASDSAKTPDNTVVGTVVQRPPSRAWKLIAVSYGPIVREELTALEELSTLPEIQQASYEALLLGVPGLSLKAFWLSGQKAGSIDYIVPIPAGPSQLIAALREQHVYTLEHFLTVVRPLATRNLRMPAGYGA